MTTPPAAPDLPAVSDLPTPPDLSTTRDLPTPPDPSTVPDLASGTVLQLRQEDWRYGGHPLRLRVEQVRHDISHYYRDEWIWIVGQRLDGDGLAQGRMEALVRVAALVGVAGPATR
ncbi:hypothetical protein O7626_38235 [Micromonospora sp. WMMD1102]|uniref:hypothetical protein n=1 Tax=Micromonospora sp. WMMD1102 TaxID=3016105 RepID=UPI002414E37C|nr:hypothetical protein [Micromonospora sp. WMMD1102]MDG4791668.1 hypothetical protein [Micromonospora sp. WMMD1102]